MARITEISQIYDRKMRELRDPQKWEDTLKRASNFWKVSLCEAMLINEQNPNATICGTLKQWNNAGRYVRRGEKSIAVFKNREDTRLEYIFDITQTYGAAINVKWVMSENIADGIVGKYNAENPSEKADSLEDFLQKSLDKSLDLIYNDININNAIAADPRAAALIVESAKCICFTRCGIEHTYNFTDSARLNSDISIIELGNAASALARDVLSDVDQIIRRKEYEHYEATVCGRPLRYPLRGEGQRVEIPDIRELRQGADAADGEKSGGFDERNRSDGTRLYQHERTVPDDLGRNREESGTTPIDDREITERKNDTERGLRSEGGTADSDRNRISSRGVGSSAPVRGVASAGGAEQRNIGEDQKDSFEYDDELIEDDEDDEAEFDEDSASPVYDGDQLTLFTDEPKYADGLFVGEYNRFALLENEIMSGTPFEGGKFRILEYCNTANPSHKELAAFLKKEYGIGGHSGYGDVDFVDYDSKGIRIRIKDKSVPDGISTAYFSWNDIAGYVEELINAGEYVTQEDIDKRAAKEALKSAETKTVTAYRVGDFYEFYGDDAILTAREINLTQTKRGSVPMTGVAVHALEDCKSRLADLGINVEVGDSRDIEKILNPENESAEKAKAALLDYAESHIAYYDSDIRQAFLNGSREDFDIVVKTTVDETISDVMSGKISELNDTDFSELYREMYEDSEFANAIYTEISDRLYAKHREIDKGRQAAHEAGLPYDEYPYDPEEDFDPYAYDPARMSDEDYDRMHDLLDAERAEAGKLIGANIRIDDVDYRVEEIIPDGSDGFLAELHTQNGKMLTERVDTVRTWLEMARADSIPHNLDKFYVNRENETVTMVYYNPDSDAGGQLVYSHFTFDQIFDAKIKDDPMDYLTQVSRQELVDVTAPNFDVKAREFLANNEDFNSREDGYLKKLSELPEPIYSIIQLKETENLRDYRFAGMAELREKGLYVDRENYRRVYRGRLADNETLEDIFAKFNTQIPEDFDGHSLSVGDIIGILRDGKPTAYYVDSAGFEEIPDFGLDLEERRVRRALSDEITLYAENMLASDEMDDLGDYLFDKSCDYHYDNLKIGDSNFPFSELHRLAERYKNGEDIRAELGRGMYALRGELSYYGKYGYDFPNPKITVTRDENGMTFRTQGGFEISYSWEQLGGAMIFAARKEYARHEMWNRACEISDIINAVRDGKPAKISEKSVEARFDNITLNFDNERGGFYLTADTPNQSGAVITVFPLGDRAIADYLYNDVDLGKTAELNGIEFRYIIDDKISDDVLNVTGEEYRRMEKQGFDVSQSDFSHSVTQPENKPIDAERGEDNFSVSQEFIFDNERSRAATKDFALSTGATVSDILPQSLKNGLYGMKVETWESRADEIKDFAAAHSAVETHEWGVHQVVTFDYVSGTDEKYDYRSLSEAIEAANEYVKGTKQETYGEFVKYDGATILNKENLKIEHTVGEIDVRSIFSEEVLKANGIEIPAEDVSRVTQSEDSILSLATREVPTITCEWSESPAFENGKTYSVAEFDRIMKQADDEHVAGERAALEKYGTHENWYNAKDEEFSRFFGYDKVKFTVNMPDGTTYTERQDIGDGFGGVIEFLSEYGYGSIIPLLKEAIIAEKENGFEEAITDNLPKDKTEVRPERRSNASNTAPEFQQTQEKTVPHNYCFPEDFSYSRGAKAKYADNVAAIKVLQTVERERRNANPDEQAILARYSGWGGIADAFDESKDNWHSEYVELKSLLSNSEYEAARASTLTAFYTEPYIINSIYKGLEHFGFKGGYILDPSMGTGNFFGNMPREMAENSRLYGVELDSLTARIAKQLYPNANIQRKGFEQTRFSDKMFDVVVGNVPFGDFKPYDNNYDDEYYIHDYFFIKSLDKLKAGGIAALITSNGTLDKYNNKARLEMYRRADLIGAIRLPNNAFKTAGTDAVTDILFFQKSGVERDIDNIDEFPDWVTCDGIQINRLWFNCNTYFGNHTGNILGEMKRVSGPYGTIETVEPYESGDIEERLDNAVMRLDARFYAEPTIEELPEIDEKEELPDGVRPFTYYVRDDKLYFAENDSTTEFTAKNKKTQQRIIDMCGIAEQVDTVIAIQRDGCSDEQLKQEQEVLNDLYDRFVKAHGNINDPINRRLFQDDIRAPKLSALEIECKNEHNEIFFRKADIFSKRTVNQHRAPNHADNAMEALHISLNLRQRVDIEYISKLCGKSEDEVIDELGENIYCNPAANNGDKYSGWETAEEYLSGHTKEKLGLAMVKAEENPDFARNVEALKKHQPIPVPITGIGFRLGSMFVPKEMFTQFMWDTFETSPLHKASVFEKDMISAEYISALNEWRIPNKTKEHSVKIDEMFGTSRINAYELTELTLNQKRAEIKDKTIDDHGNEKYVLNRKETILAREKQRKIETAFRDWVLSDSERIKRIETIFNERYNSITPRKYDGSYIVVPGMAAGLEFMPHQKNAIARFAGGGCGLVAHEVGAGKTAFSAGLGMYLKSIGAINKPMYVVPNAVIGQFGEEFIRFFPEASVLVANDKDFEKQNRRRFLAKISAGNYDAVIISQSQFEKIPLSLERQEEMYDKKINELTLSIAEIKKENGERLSVKKLESQRKSLQKNIEKLRAEFKKDNFITFEDLGCDYLIVDEAHNYKNLALFSKMHNVAGVNTSSNSQRSFDLECKTRYLQEINNGGGVILMTGTPISNAISEMFVWQYLLQYPRLKELGIEYFDNWASVFGNITQALEVKPSGSGFRMRTRFSQFVNLPELCNIFGEIADIVKTSELDIPLPQISGGKPEMIICEKSPTQEEQTEVGLARAKRIENKEVEPWEDNMLAICTYMTKVALDGRILEPAAEDFEGSKVNKCVEEILAIGKERPDTVQAVFCDTNTPTSDGFSVYKDIKEKLIASGQYKPDEVAFIHDAKNDKQKVEIFAKANEAKIRVIIGSTQKLGTGVNIQQRLIALHHLDAPFRPSDIEQRNGRGIRQGNTNPEVFVAYYATRGTFDTYRWQLLEKKQAVIAQIMSGKPAARTCEDIDEVALTFAEMKAAATDNPLIAEKLTVDNEVARLTLLKNDYISRQTALAENVKEKYPQQIATLERRLKNVFEDIKTVADNPLDDTFHMEMGGKKFYERSVAATEIEAHVKKYMYGEEFRAHEPIFVGNFHGFEFGLKHTGGNELSILLKGKNTYSSNYAFSGSGALTRLDNLFSKIQEQPGDIQSQIDFQNKQLQNAKEMLGVPFEYEAELTELLEKQSHLNMQLEFGEAPVEEIVDEENDEGESPEM